MTFIFVTIMLDMLAMGMIAPVLPRLITEFEGGSTVRAAEMMGLFATVWALMQFFCSPLLGSLSDRFGRRPIVLTSNFGLGLDYIVMALAPNMSWLFLGRVVSGITSSSVPTAMAYITDVTPPEKRAASFGMVSAALGLGLVLGPALGGLLGNHDPRLPFWVSAALSLVNALYGLFVLPESLPPEKRGSFSWKRANPVGSLVLLKRHRMLLGLACVLLLSYLTQQSFNTWVLYLDYRYGWSDRAVGLSLGAVGMGSILVGGFLVRRVVKLLGERRTMLVGYGVGWIGFAIFGFAHSGKEFLIGIPLMSTWGLAWPAAQGLMTPHVAANEQGQLQGALQGLRGIASLIGPGLFSWTFAEAIRPGNPLHLPGPGTPFMMASLMLLVAVPLTMWVTREKRGLGVPD
ncbi:TCR/Tet family MFS transporter [Silvibacterium acidisoli]|uniref:TCR/Tet family MFS transporter n=1 Tax=Acidobacteriaceae bacterium ZG23-2 TaxID=2883246 RepID=UPI00406BF5A1